MNPKIDRINFVIRDVIVTGGIAGEQLLRAAKAKGQVPVRADKSGAGAVCGFLDNFHVAGEKLFADWSLISTHPQTAQIIETAERMPAIVGLNAVLTSSPNAELIGVDFVTTLAANSDGLFGARVDLKEFSVVGSALRAAGLAAIRGGQGLRDAGLKFPTKLPPPLDRPGLTIKRAFRMNKEKLGRVGVGVLRDVAIAGGAAYAVGKIQAKQQEDEDRAAHRRARRRRLQRMSAEIATVMFRRPETPLFDDVYDATKDNLPRPEAPAQVGVARRILKSSIAKRAALKLAKIGVLAGAGGYLGHRLLRHKGMQVGAVTGAVSGILFSSTQPNKVVRDGLAFAANFKTKIL